MNSPTADSRERFSGRVEAYRRYRPGYPPELVEFLLRRAGLGAGDRIADVGAGTGIFSARLLDAGLRVVAVEPNAGMRAAAEAEFAGNPRFESCAGGAEDTGLESGSVALVSAAQAFHWFANDAAIAEFRRILAPGGRLALVWNRRRVEEPLQHAYDALLREHAPDYGRVNHMVIEDAGLEPFFAPGSMEIARFDNAQSLDFDGLIGRLHSASYCPPEDSAAYRELHAALRKLFADHAVQERLIFTYETRLYLGEPRA